MPFPAKQNNNKKTHTQKQNLENISQNIWKNVSENPGYHTVKDSGPWDMKNKPCDYCFQATARVRNLGGVPQTIWVTEIKLSLGRPRQLEFSGQSIRKERPLELFTGSCSSFHKGADSACMLGNHLRLGKNQPKDKREQHLMFTNGREKFVGHLSGVFWRIFLQ